MSARPDLGLLAASPGRLGFGPDCIWGKRRVAPSIQGGASVWVVTVLDTGQVWVS